jgi:hypothetical protein
MTTWKAELVRLAGTADQVLGYWEALDQAGAGGHLK